jgi:anti-sigma regulatory factor (Ser/Thr protein kinase)
MNRSAPDLIVLIDTSDEAERAIDRLTCVPPLRLMRLPAPPDPDRWHEEPLLYLVGASPSLRTETDILGWLDRTRARDGAPAAFLVPREGADWRALATHSRACGFLPAGAEFPPEELEQVLLRARQWRARRWGRHALRRARILWSFTSVEAADSERVWLLLESSLSAWTGAAADLSCLGIAFAEALTNAVEHGNLELSSDLKTDSSEGLLRYFAERERRLAEPRYRDRRVQVRAELRGRRLRLRIRNDGPGYDRTGIAGPRLSEVFPHGLGLQMIENLVDRVGLSADGRRITLMQRVPGARRSRGRSADPAEDGHGRRAA